MRPTSFLLYFLFFFLFFLFAPNQSTALILVAPGNGEQDVDKSKGSFQWCEVSQATKYVLDLTPGIRSVDNLGPAQCTKQHATCGSQKLCAIEFLGVPQDIRPTFNQPYTWKITAYNVFEKQLDVSAVWSFKTAQKVVATPGGSSTGGGAGSTSQKLENPISAQNLTELFNKIFSFLFGLAIFIVPVIVIYAAFLMLMGGGDPEKLAKGRMILLWTAVAFIIILLSRGLPVVFKNLL